MWSTATSSGTALLLLSVLLLLLSLLLLLLLLLSGIICTVLVYAMMLLPNATSQNSLWGVFCGSVGMCVSMLGEQLFVPGPYAVAAAV